jgi:putative endonuclease
MAYFKREHGNKGEDLATTYLRHQRYKILGRNISSRLGEIDILACPAQNRDGVNKKDIILVEVKTKTGSEFGEGFEMVNYFKKRKLLLLAKSLQTKYPKSVIRIDVISVNLATEPPEIQHFINAVEDN